MGSNARYFGLETLVVNVSISQSYFLFEGTTLASEASLPNSHRSGRLKLRRCEHRAAGSGSAKRGPFRRIGAEMGSLSRRQKGLNPQNA